MSLVWRSFILGRNQMCIHDEEFISGKMGIITTALLSHQITVGIKRDTVSESVLQAVKCHIGNCLRMKAVHDDCQVRAILSPQAKGGFP